MMPEQHSICMLTTHHRPGDPRIFEKESRSLKEMGFKVTIIIPEGELPLNTYGIKFVLYKKMNGPLRKLNTLYQLYKNGKSINASIYHCHEIHGSLLIGFLLKIKNKKKHIKLVFDCHEFWLGFFSDRMPRLLIPVFKLLFILYEKWLLKHCDHIITANSIERSYYQILFPERRITLINNVPHLRSKVDSIIQEKLYDLCFEGRLNFERGLKQLFQLMVHLKTLKQDVKLLILGAISDEESVKWADGFIEANDLHDNIVFSGWQPYKALYEFHIKCRIGIYLFQYTHNILLSDPPNKLFNFMKAGLPIVASDLPETMSILEGVGCGIAVKPDDLVAIKNAIMKLLNNGKLRDEMGAQGFFAFNSKYNWNNEEQKLRKVYTELFNERRS